MHFLPPDIEQYAEAHTEAEPPLLARLNRETHLKVMYPRMMSGHYQGRLLSLISHMLRPNIILEIGTYTGYATLCLAEGLQPGGVIHTIERDPEHAAFAANWFAKANQEAPWQDTSIVQHVGPALEMLPLLPPDRLFDLVFIDADKERVLDYYQWAVPRMRAGAVLCTDNVLWNGQVVGKNVPAGAAQALHAFNHYVAADPRVAPVLLPVRDGLLLVRKR